MVPSGRSSCIVCSVPCQLNVAVGCAKGVRAVAPFAAAFSLQSFLPYFARRFGPAGTLLSATSDSFLLGNVAAEGSASVASSWAKGVRAGAPFAASARLR